MCSNCKHLQILYFGTHAPDTCSYLRACYCSFCARNGHTTTNCPHRFFHPPKGEEPDLVDLYNVEYPPSLEVVDKDTNIRAFLLAYGVPLSGKDSVNRENLIQLAKSQTPPHDLYWIDPKTGEYTLHVDGGAPKKGQKNQKRN